MKSNKKYAGSSYLDSGFHSQTIASDGNSVSEEKKTVNKQPNVDSGLGIEYESPSSSTLSVTEFSSTTIESEKSLVGAQGGGDSGLDLSESFSQQVNVDENFENNSYRTEIALKNAEAVSEEYNRHLNPALRHSLVSQAFLPDSDGDTKLHLSVIDGRLDLVFSLIYLAPHPSYLDMQNNMSQTAIHLAVLMSQPNMVRALMLAGANLLMRDRQGDTALHLACRKGDIACVKQLTRAVTPLEDHYMKVIMGHHQLPLRKPVLLQPSMLDIQNYQGLSCVHLAAMNQNYGILLLLKKFGANIDAKEGCGGRTPLTFAVELRDPQMVDFLVEKCSASMDTVNYAGLTAFQIAYQTDRKMAHKLRSLGAQTFYDDDDVETESEDEEYSSLNSQAPSEGENCHFHDLKFNGEPLW
ncbi:hypothetical protein CHUAL_004847 [Chamberlinius hualienensis]